MKPPDRKADTLPVLQSLNNWISSQRAWGYISFKRILLLQRDIATRHFDTPCYVIWVYGSPGFEGFMEALVLRQYRGPSYN